MLRQQEESFSLQLENLEINTRRQWEHIFKFLILDTLKKMPTLLITSPIFIGADTWKKMETRNSQGK